MRDELTRLYNTLVTVETKGASTKTMADCLRYIEAMIAKIENGPNNSDRAENVEQKG